MNTSLKKQTSGAGTQGSRIRAFGFSLLTLGFGILMPDFGGTLQADPLSFEPQVDYDTGGADAVFSQIPDTQLNAWNDDPNARSEHYGASYLFMAYFLQRFDPA